MRAAFPLAPDEADNEVCEDGTACHWLADQVWNGRFPAEGSLSPNGRVLTEEMFDAVDMYHDVLRDPLWLGGETYCERAVKCDVIYPGMKGTPDAQTYIPGRLRIVDLKFGYRFVEVWDNDQLVIYAVSICAEYKLPPSTVIEFVIVQPRCNHRDGPVRTWRTTLGALAGHVAMLRDAAAKAMQPDPLCVPNPGCVDCPGRHVCVAYQQASYTAIEQAYSSVPFHLAPDGLAKELTVLKAAAKRIEGRITGLEAEANDLIRKGINLPGWQLAGTFARESWRDGMEPAVLALESYYPNAKGHLAKPLKAITPTQARKFLPAAIVAQFSHKPSTGVRLTKADPLAARKAFEPQPSINKENES